MDELNGINKKDYNVSENIDRHLDKLNSIVYKNNLRRKEDHKQTIKAYRNLNLFLFMSIDCCF